MRRARCISGFASCSTLPSRPAPAVRARPRTNQPVERPRQFGDASGRHEESGAAIVDDLRDGVQPRSNDGQARGAGFLIHEAEGLVPGGHDEKIGGAPGVDPRRCVRLDVRRGRGRPAAAVDGSGQPVTSVRSARRENAPAPQASSRSSPPLRGKSPPMNRHCGRDVRVRRSSIQRGSKRSSCTGFGMHVDRRAAVRIATGARPARSSGTSTRSRPRASGSRRRGAR